MGKIEICNEGAQMLAAGILRQAVTDYTNYVEKLAFLNDTPRATERERKKKEKEGLKLTDEEAVAFIMQDMEKVECQMASIETFFRSAWCGELCEFSSDYLIRTTKEKSVRDMCDLSVSKLKKITEKNHKKAWAQKALREFETVKRFLHTDYLANLTEKPAEYWLEKMAKESKCEFCDFL